MKELYFDRLCDVDKLKSELTDFKVLSIQQILPDKTVIQLNDAETKDPTKIVEEHIYVAPKTIGELQAEQKQQWLSAKTVEEKLDLIAQKIGLK